MSTFMLEIITPDGEFFKGEAQRIKLRTVAGDVGILPHHANYIAPLGIGEAKVVDADGNARIGACAGGMLSVMENVVTVVASTFEWADEIDAKRAERSKERAEEKIKASKEDARALAMAELKLKRALNRINVSRK